MPTIEKNKTSTPTKFQKYCEKLINRYFEQMTEGKLKLIKPSGEVYIYGKEKSADSATIEVSSYEFYTRCVLYGDIGFGESYVEGHWHTDNITEVVSWFISNTRKNPSKALNSARSILINSLGTINSIRHKFRSNTIKNSKINIHEHYDLGNEFYKIFLDKTMTYSCAYFEDKNQSLNEAQESKYDILCRKLKIQESDTVLEIGSGWGGFAEYAASNYGCSVKGITISKEQLNFSNERILKKNLQQKVNFEEQDSSMATYAKKIQKIEGKINWNNEADEILAKINGLYPQPGAWFGFENNRHKILRATLSKTTMRPGEIIDDELTISCGNKSIKVTEIQREGKKPQKTRDFLLGSKLKKGIILKNE